MDTANNAANPPSSPSGSERRYKACRTCRKQKMRCNGQSPCQRCRASGAACLYDHCAQRRRLPVSKLTRPSFSQLQQLNSLSAKVQKLQTTVNQSQLMPFHSAQLGRHLSPLNASSTAECSPSGSYDWEVLSPDELAIPVTTVHVLIHPSPRNDPQRNIQGWTPWNQSKWNREEYLATNVIERDLIDETQARRLFGSFMQHCNIATPIFDPVLDTFESVTEVYPSTLA